MARRSGHEEIDDALGLAFEVAFFGAIGFGSAGEAVAAVARSERRECSAMVPRPTPQSRKNQRRDVARRCSSTAC